MTEPDTTGVLDSVTSPALNEGWIRAVLFDHAIDDWVDLGPDPIRRRHAGQIYADHVGAAYAAWKWLSDRAGADVDIPPADQAVPDALALEIGAGDWTELMAALLTVGRAQAVLFAELAAGGDEAARRAFDRVGRDCAGHAALAFLELRRGTFTDRDRAVAALRRMVPATAALLAGTGADSRWSGRLEPLLAALGWDLTKV
ncbi:MAG TPA: hypothetical protein VEN99_12745 [Acidimicrobiia bacterium]|nr:hypothetical protein [Acidimicrobiia bacterium]